ncbi:hypothetical protein COV19_03560 [Candidatus Woesearchaeota archaeon CG10_big_fil_rev_8_21_14_0_10_44_13]|nr:MAG: hypothetical protein COV19_03560 [Candidatus Woesearchaeota archaeon CG10_big_fil_rev_8_21_14_0_10_44_13]
MTMLRTWAREYALHYCEICIYFIGDLVRDISPTTTYDVALIPDNGREVYYIDEDAQNRLEEGLVRRYMKDFKSFSLLEKFGDDLGLGFLELAKEIAKKDLKRLSNKELLGVFEEYWVSRVRHGHAQYAIFLMSDLATEMANELILKKVKNRKEQEEVLKTVFTPLRKVSVIKMKEDVLNAKDISKVYEEYKWVPCIDVGSNPWTRDEFMDTIKDFKKDPEPKYSLDEIPKMLKLTKGEEDIIRKANLAVYVRDLRDDYRRKGIYNLLGFFEEISGRIGLDREDMGYMLKEEIVAALHGNSKPDMQKIQERKKGFVLWFKGKKLMCASGKDIDNIIKKLGIEIKKETKKDIIHGVIANKGKVTGTAKIVKGNNDLGKIQKGDIIIGVTTHPNYIAAMDKAAAFVTDEGGLTSHAAIVAREMGKPCIIGTRIGTKSLKDGDIIEVDADNGMVRLVK